MTNHLILSLTSFLDFAFISVFCAAEIQSGHTRVETSSTHNKVGDPHPGVPHLTSKRSALRFEDFLLIGRELSDADARGRPEEGEEDGDPVGDRPGHVGQGGNAQGAGHVGARRCPENSTVWSLLGDVLAGGGRGGLELDKQDARGRGHYFAEASTLAV